MAVNSTHTELVTVVPRGVIQMNLWLPNIYDYLNSGSIPVVGSTLIGSVQWIVIHLLYAVALIVVALVVRTIVVQLIV